MLLPRASESGPLLLRSLLVSGERAHIPEPLPEAERAGACRTAPAHCKHFLYRWGPCSTEDRWRATGHTVTESEPGSRLPGGGPRMDAVRVWLTRHQRPLRDHPSGSIAEDRLKWSVWGRERGREKGQGRERVRGRGGERGRERDRQTECV